jgi:hypothetical protein
MDCGEQSSPSSDANFWSGPRVALRGRGTVDYHSLRPMSGTITADNLVDRSFRSKSGLALPYRLYVPLDYLQSKRYPLVLVLHGSGERGHDNRKQLQNGVSSSTRSAPRARAGSSRTGMPAPTISPRSL